MSNPANTFDLLTGLSNRYYFYEQLRSQTDLARERSYGLGVMLVDIYHMKMIQDFCGHMAGDAAIQWTANLLKTLVRPEDILTRLSGDEFGIILPVCTRPALEKFSQQVMERVGIAPFVHTYSPNSSFTVQMALHTATVSFPDEAGSDLELMHLVMERLAYNKIQRRREEVKFSIESETFPVE